MSSPEARAKGKQKRSERQVWNKKAQRWDKKEVKTTQFMDVRHDKEATKRTGIQTLVFTDEFGRETRRAMPTREQQKRWKKRR
tara:strand:- start:793 stop:1041 length:249 start_codon:yes stop_codon:yes gene_type:complete